jgi:pimeloyl-ACP methyl ester carboxylesterase
MDCPYRDYRSAAQTHARVMGMPGPMFQRIAIALAQKLSHSDFYACAPERIIPTLRCPLMVIHGADDLFVDPVDMDAVEAATRARPAELGPTVYWRARDTHHVLALRTDPIEFRRRIDEFLNLALPHRRSPQPLEASQSS